MSATGSQIVEPALTLPPELEEAYVHTNVLMLEHLQQRDLDAAVEDAHRILSLYARADISPLPSDVVLPSPLSPSPPSRAAVESVLSPQDAVTALRERLHLIRRLPPGIPAREVLLLDVQQRTAEGQRRSPSEELTSSCEDSSADSSDDGSDDETSSEDNADSSSSASSPAKGGRNDHVFNKATSQQLDVEATLARAVARLKAPRQRSATDPVSVSAGASADSTESDPELAAEEAAWVAAAEADIEGEMRRLAIARKNR